MTMPDASTLEGLALRVEQSAGADRALDVEIAVAVDWRWDEWEEGESTARGQAEKHGLEWLTNRATEGLSSMWRGIPRYTASLDAAMSLVPEGCFYGFLMDGDGGGFIACCQFAGPDQEPPKLHWIKAATPALALTAASLRALASIAREGSNNAR